MDSFSPCGLLLPFWLGREWLLCQGQCGWCPGWFGFSLSALPVVPSRASALFLAFPPSPCSSAIPGHPISPSPGGRCLAAIPKPRREQFIKEGVWQLCALSKQTLQVRLCCPGPAVPVPAVPKKPPQVLWLTELCRLGCAVSCVWLLKQLNLSCSCSSKVHWECQCFYYVLSVQLCWHFSF